MSTTTNSVTLNSGSPLPKAGCQITFNVKAVGAGGVTATNTIPAGSLKIATDAAMVSNATSDSVFINPAPIIRVRKTTLGGFGGPFQFAATNMQSAIASISTNAVNTATPSSPAAQYAADVGADVTLTETPITGYKLTGASCTDANAGATGNTGSIGTLTGNTLRIPAAQVKSNSDFTCTFTNSLVATVLVKKTTKGGFGGPFSFSATNLDSTPAAISTSAQNTATTTSSGAIVATNFNQAVTLTETPATGYALSNVSCVDTNSARTGNTTVIGSDSGNVSGNTMTIPAASIVYGATFECTFTNRKIPTIQINKISQGGTGTFSFTQTNLAASPGSLTTTTPGTVRNGTPVNVVALNTAVTVTEGTASGYKFSSVTCLDANSAITNNTGTFWTVDASTRTVTILASAVVDGAEISCTFTNTKTPLVTLRKVSQGDVGAFNFTMTNLVASSATLTTTASGTAVSTIASEVSNVATDVTLTEATVTGYLVPTVACVDANSSVTGNVGTFWTTSGRTVTIPAANVKLGADITCTFTNNKTPSLRVSKTSKGGTGTFSFSTTGSSNLLVPPPTLTTLTDGLAVLGAAVNVTAVDTAVTFTENPATGFKLTGVSCSDANSSVTGNTGTFGTLSGNVVTIPAVNVKPGAVITCALTNTKIPTVRLTKTSQGGTGTFSFTQINLASNPGNLVTTTQGTAVLGTAVDVTTADTAVTINETPASGYKLTSASCSDSNSAVTGNPASFGGLTATVNQIQIPAANVKAGAVITCALTNTKVPTVRLSKTSQGGTGTFTFTQTNLASNPGDLTTTTQGVAVTGTAVDVTTVDTAVTITETLVTGYKLSAVSCSDANSSVTGNTGTFGSVSGNVVTIPAANVKAGADISCALTNTKVPTVRLSKTSQGGTGAFSFTQTNLASNPGNLTTTIPGTAVTGTAVNVTTVDTAVTIDEAPASGFKLTAASCSDSNSAITGNPASFGGLTATANQVQIPAANVKVGADIICALTNTKVPTVRLSKTSQGGTGTFTFTQTNLASNPGDLTTTAQGVAVTGTAVEVTTVGTAVTITETPASGYKLSAVSCSDANSSVTGNTGTFWSVSGNVVTIPAANVKAGVDISCALTNTKVPTVRLSKTSQGGTGTFTFTQTNLASNPGDLTTTAQGVAVTGTAVEVTTVGTAVTITETPASGYKLSAVSCSDANSSVTGNTGTFWSVSGNVVTIPAANVKAGADISCALTNTKTPTVRLSKTSQGGTGTFTFTQTNLASNPGDLTTTTQGVAVTGTAVDVTTVGTAVTITETPASGYKLSAVSCSDANSSVTGNTGTFGSVSGNVVTIPAANVKAGADISCALTNTKTPTVRLSKTSQGGTGTFTFTQTNLASNPGDLTTTTQGVAVTGTAVDVTTVGTAVTITETPASGYKLSAVSCSDANSSVTGNTGTFGSVSGNVVTIPAANVKGGAVISCALTNTKTPTVRLSKTSQGGTGTFTFTQTNLASNPGNLTTTIPGTAVTGTAVDVTTVGTAVTITETPAPGYKLTAASCTDANSSVTGNTGTFGSVSGNVVTIPAANVKGGAVITCALTNTAIGLTGRVFADVGKSGGTANDGILNGGEIGLSGIAVRLTDCGGTIFSSAVTDATGAYTLNTLGLPAGALVCVEETNAGGMISTGASIGANALPSGVATTIAGTAYTYTRTGAIDRIAFSWDGLTHANVNFGDVPDSTFAANGAKNAVPNSTVEYPHTFTAGTAGTVVFSIPNATATPTVSGWSQKIFADPTCSGKLQPGATQLYPPIGSGQALSAGTTVCIIVQEFVPATAQAGNSDDVTVQAAFQYSNAQPSLSATYTLQDVTTVGSSALDLRKEVRNITAGETTFGINNQAKSGDVLEYRITYTNNAPTVISNLIISDKTPVFTTFKSSDVYTTPSTLTACSKTTPANPAPAAAIACNVTQAAGGEGAINWTLVGTLEPGVSGSVSFQVVVQ